MMENKHPIDELFRQGLKQDFEVDDQMWAAVSDQLPREKTAKRGLWVFNLNSINLLAILSIALLFQTDTVVKSSAQNAMVLEEQLSPKTNTNSIQSVSPSAAISKPNTSSKLNQANSIANQRHNPSAEHIADRNPVIEESPAVSQSKQDSPLAINQLQATPAAVVQLKSESAIESLVLLKPSDLHLYETEFAGSPKLVPTKPFSYSSSFYYEFELMYSFQSEKELDKLDESQKGYRENTERLKSVQSIGLNLLNDISFFQYGIGIQLSQYTERVNYTVNAAGIGYDVLYDTNYRLVNANYTNNGVPVWLIEEQVSSYLQEKSILKAENRSYTNTFKRIQIPILIGVQKQYRNFYGNLRTSLLLNYAYAESGAYIAEDLNGINSFESSDQFEAFVIGNGYQASLGYSFFEGVVIGARYEYEMDLSSFTSKYGSKFSNQGLGFWIMWRP